MAKKKKAAEAGPIARFFSEMNDDVKFWALVVTLVIAALFFSLAPFGGAGVAGNFAANWLIRFFGWGYYGIPLVLVLVTISLLRGSAAQILSTTKVGSVLFFVSLLALLSLVGENPHGGYVGSAITNPLVWLFDRPVTLVLTIGTLLISFFLINNATPQKDTILFWRKLTGARDSKIDPNKEPVIHVPKDMEASAEHADRTPPKRGDTRSTENETRGTDAEVGGTSKSRLKRTVEDMLPSFKPQSPNVGEQSGADPLKPFTPPPTTLLSDSKGKPGIGDIKANTNIIKRTLANFNIQVEMDEVSVGPSVTRYALKPAEGIKVTRILNLRDDLALALAAHPIRIEAPIPGKSLVGIEIPNASKVTVGLRSLVEAPEFRESDKPLLMALGRGISGANHYANLAKAPHLLIAGSTGSGKSVTIHTLITSLLFRNSSDNLRFIMVDPKRVELTFYDGIPHLLHPVITDAKKAVRALQWAAKEMERRYEVLKEHKVRDILSYHETVYMPAVRAYVKRYKNDRESEAALDALEHIPERMPYIVFIIDELADIMTLHPKELEAGIVRLAQMSRAVGIHLILSTQRPSVNVITGLIKANIPARIALKVSSQIDSRTILDQGGAETLLGAGDMLYLGGEMSKPQRVQSAYISEKEIKAVVKYIVNAHRDTLPDDVSFEEGSGNALFAQEITSALEVDEDEERKDELDAKYEEARRIVIEAQKASTSFLQRRMGLGYSRAAKIIDQLEQQGVIGPQQGSKPREVYVKPEEALPSTEAPEPDTPENYDTMEAHHDR